MRGVLELLLVVILTAFICRAEESDNCVKACRNINVPVCGSDNRTYGSICWLEQSACKTKRVVSVACDGLCPCKDSKIEENVQKLLFQKISHNSNDVRSMFEKEHFVDNLRASYGKCSRKDMIELPTRLIDWFHVLRLNERQAEYDDQRIEGEDLLPRMKFPEAKLKSLYSKLACVPQDNVEAAQLVCLEPVKWMFKKLDTDENNALSIRELKDIEHIHNENCIKPFLNHCDRDEDGYVVLQEFCSCLCITPPCTKTIETVHTMIMGDEPKPVGKFIPTCDEDGFFSPKQCNVNNICWCVDRNGGEIKGTRQKGDPDCKTLISFPKPDELIALDMRKENE